MKKRAESFIKAERLCGVKAVSELFAEGRTINMPSLRVVCRFFPATPAIEPVRVLITVPKRHFKKAVDRNLMRRRLKEAWRKKKPPLIILMQQGGRRADIALIWTDTEIKTYAVAEKCITDAIARVSGLKY
jgi:ribonuclease P protein component